ncbi:hypothetical protein CEUSTIGMA_g3873.t1 [Chlamydomonas eustigma]|uniref:Protein SCAI n=1 Tax=Chlamydomonas eustigma TaxID=1157962 RepID=A0A250X032_9CHLO|nr:hypothetical protein CEUSTIGMA_g3873.t1 [Chlamydomonas eustigma]|eukprot:GAX76428.1 hypothetical protein CEUSTIGMA_g3873.t1 [Chlamydomonas eustigma]
MNNAWLEFQKLLQTAVEKFSALRDSEFSDSVVWEKAYHKAFKVFSDVWLFQQQHRQTLIEAGLTRGDIGEIASKIGQLYYYFYLRTSCHVWLLESYVFYEAIHSRAYFSDASSGLLQSVKQLRFYARFIIVCLLLNKKEEAWNLVQEFQALVTTLAMSFSPQEAHDWQLVVQEVTAFLNADVAMPVPRSPGSCIDYKPTIRCRLRGPEDLLAPHTKRLSDVILASGYQHRQVKIAELPLDSFRMMLALEWSNESLEAAATEAKSDADKVTEPGLTTQTLETIPSTISAAACSGNEKTSIFLSSPYRHLLYRTTVPSFLAVLAAAVHRSRHDEVLMVHLTGQGCWQQQQQQQTPRDQDPPQRAVPDGLIVLPAATAGAPAVQCRDVMVPGESTHVQKSASLSISSPSVAPVAQEAPSSVASVTPSVTPVAQEAPSSDPAAPPVAGALSETSPAPPAAAAAAAAVSNPFSAPVEDVQLLLSLTHLHNPSGGTSQEAAIIQTAAAVAGCHLLNSDASDAASAVEQLQHDDRFKVEDQSTVSEATAAAASAVVSAQPPHPQGLYLAPMMRKVVAGHQETPPLSEFLLSPEDLLPFTRRQLLLVVDSDASHAFRIFSPSSQATASSSLATATSATPLQLPQGAFQPLCLLSPPHRPSALLHYTGTGGFFTMALTCPVMAYCLLLGEMDPSAPQLHALEAQLELVTARLGEILMTTIKGSPVNPLNVVTPSTPSNTAGTSPADQAAAGFIPSPQQNVSILLNSRSNNDGEVADHRCQSHWFHACGDTQIRRLVLRFILLRAALLNHDAYGSRAECQPLCMPPLPSALDPDTDICRDAVLSVASVFKKEYIFE